MQSVTPKDLKSSVSRETWDRLSSYVELVRKWQRAINLVAPSTLPDLWIRHIADSAQIFDLAPGKPATWLDLGSGGGFPGLVVAILAAEFHPTLKMTLIESDRRKCSFLREAARPIPLDVLVIPDRIESVEPKSADIVSARALAPLDRLLPFVARHMAPDGTALLPKGATYSAELASVSSRWHMTMEAIPSQTASDAVVLRLSGLRHAF